MKDNIFGQNLQRARKMAGLSLQELSNKINNEVSKQSLNKYEKGIMKPNSDLIIKLSIALNIDVNYFYRKKIEIKFENIEIHKFSIF